MARRLVYARDGTARATGQTVAADTAMIRCCQPGVIKQAQQVKPSTAAQCQVFSAGGILTLTLKQGGSWGNAVVLRMEQGPTGAFSRNRDLGAWWDGSLVRVAFGADGQGAASLPTLQAIADLIQSSFGADFDAVTSGGVAPARPIGSSAFAGGADDGDLVKLNSLASSRCVANLEQAW